MFHNVVHFFCTAQMLGGPGWAGSSPLRLSPAPLLAPAGGPPVTRDLDRDRPAQGSGGGPPSRSLVRLRHCSDTVPPTRTRWHCPGSLDVQAAPGGDGCGRPPEAIWALRVVRAVATGCRLPDRRSRGGRLRMRRTVAADLPPPEPPRRGPPRARRGRASQFAGGAQGPAGGLPVACGGRGPWLGPRGSGRRMQKARALGGTASESPTAAQWHRASCRGRRRNVIYGGSRTPAPRPELAAATSRSFAARG